MTKVIITTINQHTILFLYEEDNLVECHPLEENDITLGSIFLGRVDKKIPNIQSTFVKLGNEQIGYLPINKELPYIVENRELPKGLSSISENDTVLVQVIQEPQKMKQARLTTNLSLSGKYVAIDLTKNFIGISKKINNKNTQEQLKSLGKELNSNYGIIFRTEAQNASTEQLTEEIHCLTKQLDEIIEQAKHQKNTGMLLAGQPDYISILEEYGINRIDEIKTDLPYIYESIKSIHTSIQVELYQDSYDLTKLYGLETEMNKITSSKLWLKSGGFLIIEPTEAMVVIDVNSGKSVGKKNMEKHILKINEEAAYTIAKHIRLRNLSGIILVDFINMNQEEYREKIVTILNNQFRKDKVATHFIDITALELYEITRKKIRKPIYEYDL